MMGITRSLNLGLFTGNFTQTTTSMDNSANSASFVPSLSTAPVLNFNLLNAGLYTLYTGLVTVTSYLNRKNT